MAATLVKKNQLATAAAVILRADGTNREFYASADTNAARGTALRTAVAALSSGDALLLGPFTYDIGDHFLALTDVIVHGTNWKTIITSSLSSFAHAVLDLQGTVTLRNFKVIGTYTADYQRVVGASATAAAAGFTLIADNVWFEGTSDVFLCDFEITAASTWTLRGCVFRSLWDIFVHNTIKESVGQSATLTADFWGCDFYSTGNSSLDPTKATCLRTNFGTWNYHGCTLRAQSSGTGSTATALLPSPDFYDDAITLVPLAINLYGTAVTTGGAETNLDISTGGATVSADAGSIFSVTKLSGVVARLASYGLVNPRDVRRSTQFDKTNTATLSSALSITAVEAGKTYKFRAVLHVTADATGGHKYAIGGTATATAIVYEIRSLDNSTGAFVITSRQTAMAGSAGQAGATSAYTEITGTITVNAAGTFQVQFAQNVATPATTSSVLIGSFIEVTQLP